MPSLLGPDQPAAGPGVPAAAAPPAATTNDLWQRILAIMGVTPEMVKQNPGGWVNGIPYSPQLGPPAGFNVAKVWGGVPQGSIPGWEQTVFDALSKANLSPEEKKKVFNHYVNQQGVAPGWQEAAATRPAWGKDAVAAALAKMGITG